MLPPPLALNFSKFKVAQEIKARQNKPPLERDPRPPCQSLTPNDMQKSTRQQCALCVYMCVRGRAAETQRI